MRKVTDKVAIITGASKGIGNSTAHILIDAGYTVYGLARHAGTDQGINYVACDVTNADSVKQAVAEVIARAGKIDVLINNAGMGISGAVEFTSVDESNNIIDVNIKGMVNMTRECLPYLRDTKGRIINLGSVAGELPIAFQAFYSGTKAFIHLYSGALAGEVRPFGIKVTVIMPGDTRTTFTANRRKSVELNDAYGDRIKRSVERMERDEQHGADPSTVGKTILKILSRRNPPIKIAVGCSYKLFVLLNRLLPQRLVHWILYNMYAK